MVRKKYNFKHPEYIYSDTESSDEDYLAISPEEYEMLAMANGFDPHDYSFLIQDEDDYKESIPTNRPHVISSVPSEPIIPVEKKVIKEDLKLPAVYTPVYTTSAGKQLEDRISNKSHFIKTFLPVYQKILRDSGISEEYAPALVGQAALESS